MLLVARPKPKFPRRPRTYRFPEPLLEALEALAEANRRPVTTELEIAIEEHLRKSGVTWPPEPPPPAAEPKKRQPKKPGE